MTDVNNKPLLQASIRRVEPIPDKEPVFTPVTFRVWRTREPAGPDFNDEIGSSQTR